MMRNVNGVTFETQRVIRSPDLYEAFKQLKCNFIVGIYCQFTHQPNLQQLQAAIFKYKP